MKERVRKGNKKEMEACGYPVRVDHVQHLGWSLLVVTSGDPPWVIIYHQKTDGGLRNSLHAGDSGIIQQPLSEDGSFRRRGGQC